LRHSCTERRLPSAVFGFSANRAAVVLIRGTAVDCPLRLCTKLVAVLVQLHNTIVLKM